MYYNGGVDRDRGGCIEKSGTLKNKRGSGMVPKITIDREQAEWVEVEAERRIALYENENYVVCVMCYQEELFKRGEPYGIFAWNKERHTVTFTGEKVFTKPKMRPSTIEEIALEVAQKRCDPCFVWKYSSRNDNNLSDYFCYISTCFCPKQCFKALRSSPTDTTPLADLKWEAFEEEQK